MLPAGRWRPATVIGDLEWMQVPLTRALALQLGGRSTDLCRWCALLPATGLTWKEACYLAAELGGRLPTSPEWEWMAGHGIRTYPWGDDDPGYAIARANMRDVEPDAPSPVGAYPDGATPEGLWDVAGNVWEWTATPVPSGLIIRGGSYRALPFYARCDYANEVPASLTSPGIGVRVVRDR